MCVIAFIGTFSLTSLATFQPNALCVYNNSPQLQSQNPWIQSYNNDKKYEIASVSKLFVSYWALSVLGAEHRFKTQIYVINKPNGKVDLHISGDRDPYFGRNQMYLLISELNKRGIYEIENLSFDENFKIFFNVTYYPGNPQLLRSYLPSPEQVQSELNAVLHDKSINMTLYQKLKSFSFDYLGVELFEKPVLYAENIFFQPSHTLTINSPPLLTLQSAPLINYLKEMMIWSHNYVADLIFMSLGNSSFFDIDSDTAKAQAAQRFFQFISKDLHFNENDLEFYNGSGDAEIISEMKYYNKASCHSVLKTIFSLKKILHNYRYSPKDLFAVAGLDRGTMYKRYSDMKGLLLAKTGSVNVAITLAGEVSTNNGDISFSFLYKTDTPKDWNDARNQIKEELKKIIFANNGARPIPYEIKPFLLDDFVTFDQSSITSFQKLF